MSIETQNTTTPFDQIGIVMIGRNEGERFKAGLRSVPKGPGCIVYVDSGSTDDSVDFARQMGVNVVELDMSTGFTAARARNSGFKTLKENLPNCRYVQFIDGDCALAPNWINLAKAHLDQNPTTAAVWGSRRETHTDQSILNTICDIEWNQSPAGETRAFGGDVMVRRKILDEVSGYRPDVIAAEDDEISIRIRATGSRIVRLDEPMTFHDASMTRLSQWWKRARRAGYAYGLVSSIHGDPPEHYFKGDVKRTLIWGFVAPLIALVGFWIHPIVPLGVAGLYAFRTIRTATRTRSLGWPAKAAFAWGASCSICPLPQFAGLLSFYIDRLRHRTPTIIEYK